jgi:hypothetical protein
LNDINEQGIATPCSINGFGLTTSLFIEEVGSNSFVFVSEFRLAPIPAGITNCLRTDEAVEDEAKDS